MDVKLIGANFQKPQKPLPLEVQNNDVKKIGDDAEVDKLNDEIKKVHTELRETMKEAREAASESVSGVSDKAQLLQNTIIMQQQEIALKQMQIKKLESPQKTVNEQVVTITADTRPEFDEYITAKEDELEEPDNVYYLGEEDGQRKIIFNRQDEDGQINS